jgi:hypothetical protein
MLSTSTPVRDVRASLRGQFSIYWYNRVSAPSSVIRTHRDSKSHGRGASTWRATRQTWRLSRRLTTMRPRLLTSLLILVGATNGYSQTNDNLAEPHGTKVVLTGILIVSDWRCEERRAEGDLSDVLKMVCPERATDWGFVTGRNLYLLQGDSATFKKNERSRVTIVGWLQNGISPSIQLSRQGSRIEKYLA